MCRGTRRYTGSVANVKPRDSSNEGAADVLESALDDAEPRRAQSEVVASLREASSPQASSPQASLASLPSEEAEPTSAGSRVSQVVPVSPSEAQGIAERIAELAASFDLSDTGGYGDEDDEHDEDDATTTVDGSGAALAEEERRMLARRVKSAMDQTLPLGAPPPGGVRVVVRAPPLTPVPLPASSFKQTPSSFKQTMLLGLPQPPPNPAPSSVPAPNAPLPSALRASFVRAVGPPTTPPPRRSRRPSVAPSLEGEVTAQGRPKYEEPDHEAFVLSHPIVSPEPRRSRPNGAPSHTDFRRTPPTPVVLPSGMMLPPPPRPEDFDPPSSPGALRLSLPLRATIEQPAPAAWVVSPKVKSGRTAPLLSDLPASDPFTGFIAPEPSFLQRWLVVLVVALAVVGLFCLGAIALGFLGKTGG